MNWLVGSGGWKNSAALSMILEQDPRSVMSLWMTRALVVPSTFWDSATGSGRRPVTRTRNPLSCRSWAVTRPMPWVPPRMIAVLDAIDAVAKLAASERVSARWLGEIGNLQDLEIKPCDEMAVALSIRTIWPTFIHPQPPIPTLLSITSHGRFVTLAMSFPIIVA